MIRDEKTLRLIEEYKKQRQEEILKLLKEGKTLLEIAKIREVSYNTIRNWIKEMDAEEIEKAKQKGKKEEILKLLKAGKTQREIATIIGVTQTTISYWISKMDPQEVKKAKEEVKKARKKAKQEANKERDKEILELLKAGKTQREIATIMRVLDLTISNWIREMDPQEVEKAKEEGKRAREERNKEKEERKKARDKETLELIQGGKSQIEIATIMRVSASTIYMWINKMDPQEVEKAKEEGKKARGKAKEERKKARDKEILELLKAGKTQIEIATIIGVTQTTISYWKSKMDPQEVEKAKEEGKRARKVAKTNQSKSSLNYIQLKQKLKEHTITRDEIDDYREYLDDKYDEVELKEVILMSNMYIKTKRTSEAIKFLNNLIGNENMEYLGKEKLIKARNETEKIQKIQEARRLLKENNMRSTSEIATITGLNEIEVIKIKNQMQGDMEKE